MVRESSAPSVKLNTGDHIPLIGLGLWKVHKEKAADLVYEALKLGYRRLDGAANYGNEKEAGEGVRRAIKDGIVKREDVFVVSKLWSTHHEPDKVREAFEISRKDWGLDYLDLYFIHFPISIQYVDPKVKWPVDWADPRDGKVHPIDVPLEATWSEFEKLYKEGVSKNIGVSNFTLKIMKEFLPKVKVKPAVLQIEHHPLLQQKPLVQFCKENDIVVNAYSSFGGQSYVEMGKTMHVDLVNSESIKKIADKYKKTPAQLLLRWSTQRCIPVNPKSNNPQRLKENLDAVGWDIDAEDMKKLGEMDKGIRFLDPGADYPELAWVFKE